MIYSAIVSFICLMLTAYIIIELHVKCNYSNNPDVDNCTNHITVESTSTDIQVTSPSVADTSTVIFGENTPVWTMNVCNYPANELPLQDYNQLIDLRFHFTILNLVCIRETPFMLILVHSAVTNDIKRKTIRDTWGQFKESVTILFMLAATHDHSVQEKIFSENVRYRDIIQGSFNDAYTNLTYKHAMLFKYVIYHCPSTEFILKVDDDVFVNVPMFINFLTFDLPAESHHDMLYCTIVSHAVINRSGSKWTVTETEYPGKEYPTYCPGWVLLYSTDLLLELYKEIQIEKYFWIDDVHVTGTLMKKLKKRHRDIRPYVIASSDLQEIINNVNSSKINPFLIGSANLDERQIKSLWTYVSTHPRSKSSFLKMRVEV